MVVKNLNPNQIITSNYGILHDLHALKIYFRIYQKGFDQIMPPALAIHRNLVTKYLDERLKKIFKAYIIRNPKAEYFLLDGSHKTTAANLANSKCKVIILETRNDILKAKKMADSGELFQFLLKDTIREIIETLLIHFKQMPKFQTVDEKTRKLIYDNLIPFYMIAFYRKKKN